MICNFFIDEKTIKFVLDNEKKENQVTNFDLDIPFIGSKTFVLLTKEQFVLLLPEFKKEWTNEISFKN
jgi:hypothetical protein